MENMHGHWFIYMSSKNMRFGQCITFHPNNVVHLRLWQHSQGAQVDSTGVMQLRPSDISVSPDVFEIV